MKKLFATISLLCLLVPSFALAATAAPWQINNITDTFIKPSLINGANKGITVVASSTIGNTTQAGGLTISGGATTTLNAYFASNVGIGTTSPFAPLSVATPNGASGSTRTLFAIASSTATATTTLFSVDNVGRFNAGTVNSSIFFGNNSGLSSTATNNTGLGVNALSSLTDGGVGVGSLVAIGANALANATSSYFDVAIGKDAMQNFTEGNVSGGATAGQSNVAIGWRALQGVLGSSFGVRNIAIGERAMAVTTSGSRNNSIGYTSLANNTTGSDNQAIGYQALLGNTIGGSNTGVGTLSLSTATSSNGNTCVGYQCMSNFIGRALGDGGTEFNTSIGYQALQGAANMSSSQNQAFGEQTLSRLTTGGGNNGFGFRAGLNVSQGALNVLIGQNSSATLTTGSNNTVIGTGFNGTALDVPASNTSNYMNLGGLYYGNLLSAANGGGKAGIGTTTPFARFSIATEPGATGNISTLFAIASSTATATTTLFSVQNDGTVYAPVTTSAGTAQTGYWCYDANGQFIRDTVTCLVSSEKFKQNIAPLDSGSGLFGSITGYSGTALDEVLKLNPVSFDYKKTGEKSLDSRGRQVGFLAEEVYKVDPRLVELGSDGLPHAVNYQTYTAVLTGAIQELAQAKGLAPLKRSAEENWQWVAIGLLALSNLYLIFRRR